MGCDIHLQIEYRKKGSTEQYQGFKDTRILNRDYTIFGCLAGVREQFIFSPSPKGLPDNISDKFKLRFYLYVVDNLSNGDDDEFVVSRAQAEEWVKDRLSEWSDDDKNYITHPDWHTVSWMTTQEYRQALDNAKSVDTYVSTSIQYAEYEGVLATMEVLEESGNEARIVFYFDS